MTEILTGSGKLMSYDFYLGTLSFTTPLHIGHTLVGMETDAGLLRDAAGRIYIPGSSIMGPLRARATKRFPGVRGLLDRIFGTAPGDGQGEMARLWVEDAYPGTVFEQTTIRDGVAIDRRYDAAADGGKFDLEVTPPDACFALAFRLALRDGDEIEKTAFIVDTILEDLQRGRVKLGGGKTRGLGRCGFDHVIRRLDFNDRPQLLDYLVDRDPSRLPRRESTAATPPSGLVAATVEELVCTVTLEVTEDPFLIKDARDDSDADAVFVKVVRVDGGEVEYVPGSSLKGVFRARAEKILRTLGGQACLITGEDSCSGALRKLIKVQRTFEENDFDQIRRHSCSICRLFGNAYLAGRMSFDDAFFDPPLDTAGKKLEQHVAIDRFTGGAAKGKLFSARPVIAGSLRLTFEISEPRDMDKALLLFLLRDLREGFPPLRFGHGKTRGMGLLECREIRVNQRKVGENGLALSSILDFTPAPDSWWQEKEE